MFPPALNRSNSNGTGAPGQKNGILTVLQGLAPKKKVPPLTEEAKKNQKRDITPEDIEDPQALLDDIDFSIKVEDKKDASSSEKVAKQLAARQLIVDDVMRDFKLAANAKAAREEKWYLAAAFERDNQWVEYDRSTRRLRNRWNDPDAEEYFKTVNKIAPLLRKNTSRALASSPDLDFVPVAPGVAVDKLAAKQCRQVWHHAKKFSKWDEVKEEGVYFGQCYPIFWKVVWDAEAEDDIPEFKIIDPAQEQQGQQPQDTGSPQGEAAEGGDNDVPPSPVPPTMVQQALAGQQGQTLPPTPPGVPQGGPQGGPQSPAAQMLAAIQQGRQQAMQQGVPGPDQEPTEAGSDDELQPLNTPESGEGQKDDEHASELAREQAEPITSLSPMLRIVGSVRAPVGMTKIEYVAPFEAYPDPDARHWEQIRFFIHARRVPISEVQATFGGVAYLVKPDKGGGGNGMESVASDARLAGITGDDLYGTGDTGDYVTLFERWEFKSPKYPEGRYSAVADNRLLKHTVLDDQEFPNPFVPFYYQREVNSIWGRGIVPSLVDSQIGYNSAFSHMMSRMRMDKLFVMAEEGIGLRPDDYISGLDYRKIYHKKGMAPPQLQSPPADWEKYERVMELCERQMEDAIGIHDSSDGQQESAQQSGRQTYLLQQADNRIIREYTRRIEDAEVAIAERVISCFSKYATEPRLIAIDDELEGDIPAARLFMPDLMRVGKARCEVTVGSAMPETPGEEEAQLERWYEMQLFGAPGSPEAGQAFLGALPTLKSSKLADTIVPLLEQQQQKSMAAAQAMEQQKQSLEAQQANLETQQKLILLQTQGQQAAALQAQKYQLEDQMIPKGARQATPEEEQTARVNADLIIGKFNAEKEAAAAQQNAALEVGKTAAVEHIKHVHSLVEAEQQHQHDLAQGQMDHAHDLTQTAVQGTQQAQMQDKQLTAQEKAAKLNAQTKAKQASTKK